MLDVRWGQRSWLLIHKADLFLMQRNHLVLFAYTVLRGCVGKYSVSGADTLLCSKPCKLVSSITVWSVTCITRVQSTSSYIYSRLLDSENCRGKLRVKVSINLLSCWVVSLHHGSLRFGAPVAILLLTSNFHFHFYFHVQTITHETSLHNFACSWRTLLAYKYSS